MSRKIISTAVAAVALLAAFGCGSGTSDTSVGSGTAGGGQGARVNVADGAVDAAGLRTVTYQGVAFQVPGDWPVYDLAADPTTCVRFDVHAVYLGQPSADMQCPAGLIGRAEAVLVEGDPIAQPGGARPGADKDEQRPSAQLVALPGTRVLDEDPFEGVVTQQFAYHGAEMNGDAWCPFDPVDEGSIGGIGELK